VRGARSEPVRKPRAPKPPHVELPPDEVKRLLLEHPWLTEEDLKRSALAAGKRRRRRDRRGGAKRRRKAHPDEVDWDSGTGSEDSESSAELED